jgi:hypothetical protein
MATLKPKPQALAKAKPKPKPVRHVIIGTNYGDLLEQQEPEGDFTDMKLKKGNTVYLDMKLEGEDKEAAGGQSYITLGRCSVTDPAPLVYCPLTPGGPNVVHARHDYTEVVFDRMTNDDDNWLCTDLGALCVFLPVAKKNIAKGYPSIEDPDMRTVAALFCSTMTWIGASGVASERPQVINCCHFLCVLCVMSHLIPPLSRTSSTPAT